MTLTSRVLLRRPATVALCTLAVFAVAWPIAASAGARNDPDAQEAAQLVRGTRDAAADLDFSGVATITWTTSKGEQSARVQVSDTGGAISVRAADGNTVVDEGRRTYLRDHLGWTGLVVEPTAHDLPAPDRRWVLSTGATRTVAGRPATVVLARRPGGEPVQRLAVDDATGLLLAREVLGPDGGVERSVRFTTIDVGERASSTAKATPPTDVRTPTAEKLTSVPDGYRAPGLTRRFRVGDALASPRRRAPLLQRRRVHRVGVRAAG